MWEQLKKYREIARLALLQEKASKNSKIKGMNEHEKEFLPAVLEVTEMPPSHAARLLTYVIVAMFTVLILWSVIGKSTSLQQPPENLCRPPTSRPFKPSPTAK